jgi:hypothetical protein
MHILPNNLFSCLFLIVVYGDFLKGQKSRERDNIFVVNNLVNSCKTKRKKKGQIVSLFLSFAFQTLHNH